MGLERLLTHELANIYNQNTMSNKEYLNFQMQ
jgi:hypothetical protein